MTLDEAFKRVAKSAFDLAGVVVDLKENQRERMIAKLEKAFTRCYAEILADFLLKNGFVVMDKEEVNEK